MTFAGWVRKYSADLSLQAEELSWIKSFFPNVEDISARIKIQGREYFGRGHSSSKEMAFQIAVAEALERAIAAHNFQTTNGLAVHMDINQAKINARNELIERDLFLSHFLTQEPFSYSPKYDSFHPNELKDYISSNNDQISIYKMKRTNLGSGFLCVISNCKSWGGIVGLSFGLDSDKSLVLKATLESLRQYWHLRNFHQLENFISIEKFQGLENWTFHDHGKLALNPSYFRQVENLFPTVSGPEILDQEVIYSEKEFSYKKQVSKVFLDCPLIAIHCASALSQQLSPGPQCSVNTAGLNRFSGGKEFNLNRLPHPIN